MKKLIIFFIIPFILALFTISNSQVGSHQGGWDTSLGYKDVALWGFAHVDSPNVFANINAFDSLKATSSIWWYCKYMDAINLSPGGSGAVETIPTDNTIGGYQLDGPAEYLYFNGAVCNNWGGESDMEVVVRWERNAGLGGANDSIFFDMVCWYKGIGEMVNKSQNLTAGELIGTAGGFTMYSVTFTIDYDIVDNVVQVYDVFSFRLNLNTVRSDLDDVIVNFINFRYKTKVPQPKNY